MIVPSNTPPPIREAVIGKRREAVIREEKRREAVIREEKRSGYYKRREAVIGKRREAVIGKRSEAVIIREEKRL